MSGFRKYGRIRAICKIELSSDKHGVFTAETRDISDAGVFVYQREACKCICIGDQISATWESPSKYVINATMKVVRTTDDGIGLTYE